MPIPYIPRPIDIKNTEDIERLGLDTSKLSRSQIKGLDAFITLIKPAKRRSDLRETVDSQIEEFTKHLLNLSAAEVRDSLRSVKAQINNLRINERDVNREYRFDLDGDINECLPRQKKIKKAKKAKALKSKKK